MLSSSKVKNAAVFLQACFTRHIIGFKYSLKRSTMSSITVLSEEPKDLDADYMPPSCVRGMKVLNRDCFEKKVVVPAVCVPVNAVNNVKKKLQMFMLRMPNLQPVLDSGGSKMILLHPKLISNNPKFEEIVGQLNLQLKETAVGLTYENWGYSSIAKAILPVNSQLNVTSFSIIGHIVHMNFKEEVTEYKNVLAEVILDKISSAKTVVNKTKAIDGVYRNFSMEVLAGEPNFQVCVKENTFKYEFDFSKVFWNPRLSNEHSEIVKRMKEGDIVFDVFAGVGPFAIPAAKKKCTVYANDLNPDSYKWLCHNSHLNKVNDYLTAYNLDGRAFICSVVKEKLTALYNHSPNVQVHILMNLPASAVEFIESFDYLLKGLDDSIEISLPIVYCYFFASEVLTEQNIIDKYLSADLAKNIKELSIVRNIAPKKRMFRLVFTIPREILFKNDSCAFVKSKRMKLDYGEINT